MPKQPTPLTSVIKRDGSTAPFNVHKIEVAVEKAMKAAGEFKEGAPAAVAEGVVKALEREVATRKNLCANR